MSAPFPFTAVVGQSQMKLALLLCLVDPGIGGVLLSGGRGSAKTTLVRSLSTLLPDRQLVTLPLGATEEMVIGSINLEKALNSGEVGFNPGLLARAHQGLLYVDEVNLLADHLVDQLLDVAASHINLVERDGISHQHPAEFVLVGTMNPDEGELRPQLLDRFGLMAQVQSRFSVAERQQIVEQRLAFDDDPAALIASQATAMQQMATQITNAIRCLKNIRMPASSAAAIASLCENAGVEGMRADITLHRAATAHAAMEQRSAVTEYDIDAVAELVLSHRRQSQASANTNPPAGSNSGDDQDHQPQNGNGGGSSIQGSWGAMAPQPVASNAMTALQVTRQSAGGNLGKLIASRATSRKKGRHAARQFRPANVIAGKPDWFRTLVHRDNLHRVADQRIKPVLRQPHGKAVELDMVLLDTSASVVGGGGLAHAKGIIRGLSVKAYLGRRQLSIVTFGNQQVQTVLNPQRAPKDIEPVLQTIQGGGGTPLADALTVASNLIRKMQQNGLHCSLYLLTDGRSQQPFAIPPDFASLCKPLLIDIESARVKLGMGRNLAAKMGADYLPAPSPGNTAD